MNPFAVLLADDFLTDYAPGVTADLVDAFEKTGNSQLSVMPVDEAYISQYGVIIPSSDGHGVIGWSKSRDRMRRLLIWLRLAGMF